MASHSRHRSSSPESPPPSHQAAAPMLTPPTQCQKLEPPSIAPSQLPPRKRIHSLKKQFTKPNLEVPMVQPLHPLSPNPPWPLPPASSTGSSSGTTLPPIPVSTDALSDMQPDSHDSPIVDIESEGDTAETDEEDWQQRKLSDEASTASDTSASKQKQAIIIQGNQGPAVPVPLFDLPLTSTSDQTKPLKKPRKIKEQGAEKFKPPKRAKRGRPPGSKTVHHHEKPLNPSKPKGAKRGRHLYCVCQTPYDMNSPRFMIACDRCDQWFHGECIGIDEKQGEFIDLHFCDRCSQETGKTTSWKPKCGNPACEKPGRVGTHQGYLSKYCSQNCGMQVARARLELADMKRKRHALTQHVQEDEPVYSASIPDLVIHRQLQSQLNTCSEQQDQQRLQQIKSIRQQALEHVEMIAFKHAFLTSLPEPDNGTCGFDGRLTMDDALWMEAYRAAQVPPTAEVCSLGSKQCPRHTQWARLTGQVLALERQEQLHVLQRLRREKQLIQSRKQHRHDPVHLAQAVGHGAKKVNT